MQEVALTPQQVSDNIKRATMREVLSITAALGGIVALGVIAPSNFMTTLTTFTLAGIVGYKVHRGARLGKESIREEGSREEGGIKSLTVYVR